MGFKAMVMPITNTEWWRGACIYQVYPRSFMDSNSDGIGDLNGITRRLDYIAALGVDAVWISPFFPSPMKDFGYDVSDFKDVDPVFGTLADFDALLHKAHSLDLKIIIDLVLSHTSNLHPWFQDSRQSADNNKSDWYVWADPHPDGSPPNNWQSVFGGPAWTFDTARNQYYLHNFLTEQPDLNYHNAGVQAAIFDTMRFWLDRGVDGFRLDVVNFYFHDRHLRDNPPRDDDDGNGCIQYEGLWPYTMQKHFYDKSQPENIPFLESIRALVDTYPDRFIVGELGDDNPFELAAEYTKGCGRLHTVYSTSLMSGQDTALKAGDIINAITEEKSINGESWPCWAFSNHDVTRVASRWHKNNPDNHPNFVKTLIALLGCLRGTFCLYQGEELGLPEAILRFEDLTDPWGIAAWPKWQGRDGCRTPMVWDDTRRSGFSNRFAKKPWLPVCARHKPLAISRQNRDPHSPLNFTRDFLAWRRHHPVLRDGDITFHDQGDACVVFERISDNGTRYLCAFNLGVARQNMPVSHTAQMLYGLDSAISDDTLSLASFGFAVVAL